LWSIARESIIREWIARESTLHDFAPTVYDATSQENPHNNSLLNGAYTPSPSSIAERVNRIVDANKDHTPSLNADTKRFVNGSLTTGPDGIRGDELKAGTILTLSLPSLLSTTASSNTTSASSAASIANSTIEDSSVSAGASYDTVASQLPKTSSSESSRTTSESASESTSTSTDTGSQSKGKSSLAAAVVFGSVTAAALLAARQRRRGTAAPLSSLSSPMGSSSSLDDAITLYLGNYAHPAGKEPLVRDVLAATGVEKRELYQTLRERGYTTRAETAAFARDYLTRTIGKALSSSGQALTHIARELRIPYSTARRYAANARAKTVSSLSSSRD
jgi:hypothetical protein